MALERVLSGVDSSLGGLSESGLWHARLNNDQDNPSIFGWTSPECTFEALVFKILLNVCCWDPVCRGSRIIRKVIRSEEVVGIRVLSF